MKIVRLLLSTLLVVSFSIVPFINGGCSSCGSSKKKATRVQSQQPMRRMPTTPTGYGEEESVSRAPSTNNRGSIETGRVVDFKDLVARYGDANKAWQALLEQPKVVVDFFGPRCPRCDVFAPIFESGARSNMDILFVKVNTDQYSYIATRYGVRPLPAIHLFYNKKEVAKIAGSDTPRSVAKLQQFLRRD